MITAVFIDIYNCVCVVMFAVVLNATYVCVWLDFGYDRMSFVGIHRPPRAMPGGVY